jgi:serine/threonine protein kinase
MTDARTPGESVPGLNTEMRHDSLCDDFEQRWKQGAPARIEDVLESVPLEERPALFVHLMRVERAYKPHAQRTEYRVRFPDFEAQLETAFYDPDIRTNAFQEPSDQQLKFTPPAIPDYELFEELGRGGMGVVYRARPVDLGRFVAVKVMRIRSLARQEDLLRFRREAEAVAGLNHPNVVQLYAFGWIAEEPYYVMELVEGGSLAARLKREPADLAWSLGLIETVAWAMNYVHERKLIHRDLKPANILLATDGTPKIADFGLVKRLAREDVRISFTTAVLGTPCYMAPEQATGTKEVGPAADIYALGVILFELLTGRLPFLAETYTLDQLLHEDPPRPSHLAQYLSPDLDAVCLKCLEKQPERRYATAGELAADLARVRSHEPPTARPVPDFERDARWAQKIGYELCAVLASSSEFVTYSARQTTIDRPVLLKHGRGAPGVAQRDSLRREAKALASIDHPNVLKLHDWAERGDQAYLVTEFADGAALLAGCLGSPPQTPRRAAEIALRTTLGLQALHESGLVHGRLTSHDIVLFPGDVPKIGNLGAPQPAGAISTDIRGLGTVLAEMLTGRPTLNTEQPDVPPKLATIWRRCFTEQPTAQFTSAGSLALELQLFLTNDRDLDDTVELDQGQQPPFPTTGFRLRIVSGPTNVGSTLDLTRRRAVIGRREDCDLRLRDDARSVSRLHCGVVWNPVNAVFELVDLSSRNGTTINGQPIRTAQLSSGDRIQIADYVVLFEACESDQLPLFEQ